MEKDWNLLSSRFMLSILFFLSFYFEGKSRREHFSIATPTE
jgi:hypothetical protein